jgi:hypothetical protein
MRTVSGIMSEPAAAITLIYTANLRGNLDILPRLHAYIRRLKPDGEKTYLLDLGGACDPAVWHCAVTGGRSALVVLDGMGYDAANVSALAAEERAKLAPSTAMALVDSDQTILKDDLLFAVEPTAGDGPLCVVLSPAPATRLRDNVLHLGTVKGGAVGRVRLMPGPRILNADLERLPPDVLPDPTISGIVDFVLSEAHYFKKRLDEKSSN